MKPLRFYLVRTGLLLLFLSIASYLLGIWESGVTAERFGLTGVALMAGGLISLVVGGLMAAWHAGSLPKLQDDEDA